MAYSIIEKVLIEAHCQFPALFRGPDFPIISHIPLLHVHKLLATIFPTPVSPRSGTNPGGGGAILPWSPKAPSCMHYFLIFDDFLKQLIIRFYPSCPPLPKTFRLGLPLSGLIHKLNTRRRCPFRSVAPGPP